MKVLPTCSLAKPQLLSSEAWRSAPRMLSQMSRETSPRNSKTQRNCSRSLKAKNGEGVKPRLNREPGEGSLLRRVSLWQLDDARLTPVVRLWRVLWHRIYSPRTQLLFRIRLHPNKQQGTIWGQERYSMRPQHIGLLVLSIVIWVLISLTWLANLLP